MKQRGKRAVRSEAEPCGLARRSWQVLYEMAVDKANARLRSKLHARSAKSRARSANGPGFNVRKGRRTGKSNQEQSLVLFPANNKSRTGRKVGGDSVRNGIKILMMAMPPTHVIPLSVHKKAADEGQ